ncbi:hypothetical protein pipiens_018681 [Culex pipiens pipiens]|uniref:Integrator complex subunit 7 C-terminal domain-containing protein n=1 Tax=Culex pipiens pipiens TaxID=38569 RepID=A0ABD1CAK3_CULPP
MLSVLQNTSVKLALTPQPRVIGEPIFVQPSSNLVVKVEGVIQHHGKKPSVYRSIESVQLTLSSQPMPTRPNDVKWFLKGGSKIRLQRLQLPDGTLMKTGVFRAGLSAKSLPTELYDDKPGESKTGGDRSSVGTVSCACKGFLFQRFETDRSFVDFVVETAFSVPEENSGGNQEVANEILELAGENQGEAFEHLFLCYSEPAGISQS